MVYDFIAPSLFGIGAAKAATSSLQKWLGDHPQIATSTEEEARFLMDADDPLAIDNGYARTGLAGYAACFPPERRQGDIRHALDVTPMYYYQKTAREVIPTLPGSRVIFIARRPSTRLKSLYDFAQHNMGVLPHEISFSEFVDEMGKGPDSPVIGRFRMMANGFEHSHYAKYLRQWIDTMGSDRVTILFFEEMVKAPRQTMKDLAALLDIDPDFYDSYPFPRENQSFQVHNRRVHKLARSMRSVLPPGARQILKPPYMWMNVTLGKAPVNDADTAALAYIDKMFENADQELSDLLGRQVPWR